MDYKCELMKIVALLNEKYDQDVTVETNGSWVYVDGTVPRIGTNVKDILNGDVSVMDRRNQYLGYQQAYDHTKAWYDIFVREVEKSKKAAEIDVAEFLYQSLVRKSGEFILKVMDIDDEAFKESVRKSGLADVHSGLKSLVTDGSYGWDGE